MNIIYKGLEEIHPYANNPRNNDDAVEAVANSIKEFGFKVPIIIDKNGEIIAGHTRYKASMLLGLTEVPCIIADDLTEDQVKAFRIADNKVAEIATWDFDLLAIELGEISLDMSQFGFDIQVEDPAVEIVEDDIPSSPADPVCKLGDIWRLGRHRLICGDSTSVNTYERLMEGKKADICVTSPPYNAGHMDICIDGKQDECTKRKYINDDDKTSDEEYFDFICANVDALLAYATEIFYNVGVSSGTKDMIGRLLSQYAEQFKDFIYWEKDNAVPQIQENCISSAVELIICLGQNGSRGFARFKNRKFHGVIHGTSASCTNEYANVHKATYPVYLPAEIIENFTTKDGIVLDCFGGTGTTMIACEQTSRTCYMIELEPRYCDIIIQRWERLTGGKAELVND